MLFMKSTAAGRMCELGVMNSAAVAGAAGRRCVETGAYQPYHSLITPSLYVGAWCIR